jgi:hypothetical protein
MVSVLTLSGVDDGLEPWSSQANDYNIAGVMVSVLTLSGVDDGLEPWSSQ